MQLGLLLHELCTHMPPLVGLHVLQGGDKGHPDVVEKVRSEYLAALERAAAGRELSIRARSHLKQACLAAATHKVLLELSPV